jgi:hypothetical protein
VGALADADAREQIEKNRVDPVQMEADFLATLEKTDLAKQPLYLLWVQALHDRRLPSVAFYTQQLKDRKILDSSSESLVEAAGLLASESQAEAAQILKAASQSGQIKNGSIADVVNHNVEQIFAYETSLEAKTRAPAQVNPEKKP